MTASFDHPIGAKQDGGFGEVEAELLGRPKVHHQFEPRGLKDREIGLGVGAALPEKAQQCPERAVGFRLEVGTAASGGTERLEIQARIENSTLACGLHPPG